MLNAVHEPHQVTKLGWPVANFLAYACFLLSLYPLYLAPYFFSFKPPSTCLTFQPVWFLSNTDFIGSVRWGVTRHYSQQQLIITNNLALPDQNPSPPMLLLLSLHNSSNPSLQLQTVQQQGRQSRPVLGHKRLRPFPLSAR